MNSNNSVAVVRVAVIIGLIIVIKKTWQWLLIVIKRLIITIKIVSTLIIFKN